MLRNAQILLAIVCTAAFFIRGSVSSAAYSESYFVRLDTAEVALITQLNLTPLTDIDYGSFRWLELSAADFTRLQAGRNRSTSPGLADFTLHFGRHSFDPLRDSPPQEPSTRSAQGSRDFHLVQLIGPTRPEWLAELEASGLEIVQYIHPFTYVVWGNPAALDQSEGGNASFIRWQGPFLPAYRSIAAQERALTAATPGRFTLLMYRRADPPAVLRAIERLGGVHAGSTPLNATWEAAVVTLPAGAVAQAAQIPGVYTIQPKPQKTSAEMTRGEVGNQINAGNYDSSNHAFPGYQSWLQSVGLDGSGVLVAHVDDGAYNAHPDLASRFAPCAGVSCGGSAQNEHGTHTAGILAGDASSGVLDANGFLRGLGMAPGVQLVEQLSWLSNFEDGMLQLMAESHANGAVISSNSWGPSGLPRGYDSDTLQVDIGVRDAGPDTAGNQALTYVLAFMNGYGGVSSQGTPDEAKNTLTVGSSYAQSPAGEPLATIDDLSNNTAHGPALDGRTIPHLVAPGKFVDSTWVNVNANPPTASYALLDGTSMAAPHAAGAAALFVEYYRGRFGVDPSPAMLKAAFLPVAHDLAGHKDADGQLLGHPFDSKQGWGRLNLAAVVDPAVAVQYLDAPQILEASGERWHAAVDVDDPSRPVRLMLVWTDAPGHGLGGSTPAWNNDLDLIVQVGGERYYGNDFGPNGWSRPGMSTDADYRNNTEGVFLQSPAQGSFLVEVRAGNLTSDGIPNQGAGIDQDFALACYNCAAIRPVNDLFLPFVARR